MCLRFPSGLAVALLALLLPAGASSAAVTTFGSDLTREATVAETHGADSAFWNTSLASGQSPMAPADGQVVSIRLRGFASRSAVNGNPGDTQIHFQDLHPNPDGSATVTVTTNPFNVPSPGNPDTISTFKPENFCVHRGDHVDFNDEGGFDGFGIHTPPWFPDGVPFQVFARAPGSTTQFFSHDGGTFNGFSFAGTPRSGQELLAQFTLATGPDAVWLCPGGTAGAPHDHSKDNLVTGPPATAPSQRDGVNARGVVSIAIFCHGPQACTGTMTLKAGSVLLGSAPFAVGPHRTGKVRVHLGRAVVKLLHKSRAGRLPVLLSLASGRGAPADTSTKTIVLSGARH